MRRAFNIRIVVRPGHLAQVDTLLRRLRREQFVVCLVSWITIGAILMPSFWAEAVEDGLALAARAILIVAATLWALSEAAMPLVLQSALGSADGEAHAVVWLAQARLPANWRAASQQTVYDAAVAFERARELRASGRDYAAEAIERRTVRALDAAAAGAGCQDGSQDV